MNQGDARGRRWSQTEILLQEAVALLGAAVRELRAQSPEERPDDHLAADLARVAAVLSAEALDAGEGGHPAPVRWQRLLDALIDFDAYVLLAEVGDGLGEVLEVGGQGLDLAAGESVRLAGLALEEAWKEGHPVAVYATKDQHATDPRLAEFPARLAVPALESLVGGGLVVLRSGLPFSAAEANSTACLSLSLSPHIDRHYLARACRLRAAPRGERPEPSAGGGQGPAGEEPPAAGARPSAGPTNDQGANESAQGARSAADFSEPEILAATAVLEPEEPRPAPARARATPLGALRQLPQSATVPGLLGAGLCRCPSRPHCPTLQRLDRLATLGQMVASVSHELNNALTAVMGFTELLVADEVPDSLRATADQVQEQAERAARMVRDLLAFSRAEPSEQEAVDVNDLVRRTAALRERELRVENISLVLRLAEDLPPVVADHRQVQQVLLNLLLNAEQAISSGPGKGSICISTAHRPAQDCVVFCVADDGPGIPLEDQDRIFEPFHTTKLDEGGTGLGLAVCLAIVAHHEGRLYCESTPGEGARFFVELPAGNGRVIAGTQDPASPSETLPPAARVLLVDDEPSILELMQKVLSAEGLEVETAETGREALRLLRERSYSLVISDLRMPDVNGWMLYQHMLRHHPELAQRLIFTTGDMAATEDGGLLKETGLLCLAKPFSSKELLALVRRVLETNGHSPEQQP